MAALGAVWTGFSKSSVSDINGLDLGVELDRGEALLARAVARFADAAERHMIVDPRGRQVDHHHPGADVAAEMPGMLERAGDDACGQAELAAIGELQRLLVVPDADRGDDRAE